MTAAPAPPPAPDLFHLPEDGAGAGAGPADPDAEAQIGNLLREFRRDVAYARRRLAGPIRTGAGYLVPEREWPTLPARARAVLDRYALVDALALRYRGRTRSTFIGLLALAFLAMLVLELFAHVLPESFPAGPRLRLVFWLFPALWLGAGGLWYHAHRRRYQRKYHDYRALAEGLRVQFFWDLLGLEDRVERHYLGKQEGELEWIRRALAWWRDRDEEVLPAAERSAEQRAAHKDLVRRSWVQGQLDYFTGAAPREGRRGERCKRWGALLFWASLGLSAALGGWEVWHLAQPDPEPHTGLAREEGLLVFAISLLLAGAAVAVAYGEKMAFSEHARQYAATRVLYSSYARQLGDGPLTPEEAELFRTLGKEALQENGDWLLLHRDRPLEVIVP
jgi:hypothetical protein